LNSHQIIFFYSKTKKFKFNHIFEGYSPTTNIDQIFQKRIRDKNGKTKYKTDDSGECELMEGKKGVPLSDVWEIPYLNPKANERVGYPTQKPILLLERIIELTTNNEDIVVDPFCGSGTTLVAAKLLHRKYIGIDISDEAIELSKKRLENPIKSESRLMKNGKSTYLNQKKEILLILESIDAIPVQRNKGIDGFLRINNLVKPIPVKIQRNNETVDKATQLLTQAASKNGFKQRVLIKTNDTKECMLFISPDNNTSSNLIVIDNIKEFINNKKQLLLNI
jgi:site-specific DNA-methyltransferase (adenine-specific)